MRADKCQSLWAPQIIGEREWLRTPRMLVRKTHIQEGGSLSGIHCHRHSPMGILNSDTSRSQDTGSGPSVAIAAADIRDAAAVATIDVLLRPISSLEFSALGTGATPAGDAYS
jgi:hypothetical protein